MKVIVGKAPTSRVWHFAVFARYEHDQIRGRYAPLCGVPTSGRLTRIEYRTDVAGEPLCAKCCGQAQWFAYYAHSAIERAEGDAEKCGERRKGQGERAH